MTLEIINLSHTYPTSLQPVLQPMSTQFRLGDQVLLRGISGSGKTTLLNILAGLLTPTTGSVQINGQSIYTLSEAERDNWRRGEIGYVFQTHHLLPTLNAWENVAMPRIFANISKKEAKEEAIALLTEVGLGSVVNKRPKHLSTGQRQRVAIARALINQPTLILADEPTASLDAHSADTVLDLLQKTCHQHNKILLVASHDPALNGRFSLIADLKEGELTIKEVQHG